MELAGRVIAVLEPKGGTSRNGNEWKVQEYVIETHDQYPRRMCFDVFGDDKIKQFNIQVGEELNVSFEARTLVQQYPCMEGRTCGSHSSDASGRSSIPSGKCSSGRLLHDRRERRSAVLNEYGNLKASFASGKMK